MNRLLAAILLAVLVYAALRYSQAGRALRSLASNPAASPLVGIDVDRLHSFTFALGAGLAALVGLARADHTSAPT